MSEEGARETLPARTEKRIITNLLSDLRLLLGDESSVFVTILIKTLKATQGERSDKGMVRATEVTWCKTLPPRSIWRQKWVVNGHVDAAPTNS